jgi:hypothetical protein
VYYEQKTLPLDEYIEILFESYGITTLECLKWSVNRVVNGDVRELWPKMRKAQRTDYLRERYLLTASEENTAIEIKCKLVHFSILFQVDLLKCRIRRALRGQNIKSG